MAALTAAAIALAAASTYSAVKSATAKPPAAPVLPPAPNAQDDAITAEAHRTQAVDAQRAARRGQVERHDSHRAVRHHGAGAGHPQNTPRRMTQLDYFAPGAIGRRQRYDVLLGELRLDRSSFEPHWRDLGDNIAAPDALHDHGHEPRRQAQSEDHRHDAGVRGAHDARGDDERHHEPGAAVVPAHDAGSRAREFGPVKRGSTGARADGDVFGKLEPVPGAPDALRRHGRVRDGRAWR
jgi:hypothetical protein